MGKHATESISLSGKSLPHVNELSLSLGANKFCPISLQPSFNSFILCELDVTKNLWFSNFLSLLSFSHEKQWLPFVFILYVCEGCALSFKSNPTWLSFTSDECI